MTCGWPISDCPLYTSGAVQHLCFIQEGFQAG
jgi:hypothetical protein